jgi:Domain of unknown function (DUF6378)
LTPRGRTLEQARVLIEGQRAADYGPPELNHARIAAGWSEIFERTVSPHQVALAMAWLKMCRLIHDETNVDSWVDAAGYIALGSELATRDHE